MGRIPHGFYEHEIRQYLEQFGPVTNVRLSRNKKTGASKHFAFVEFEEYTTAETVVKTMDNYLLFGHILKLRMIPEDDVHEDLFKGANSRFKKVPWAQMRGKDLEKPQTEQAWEKKVKKEQSKRAAKAAKLKALGYDFEEPQLQAVPPPAEIVVDEKAAIEAAEEVKAIEAPAVVTETIVETPTEVTAEVTVETTPKGTKTKAPKKKAKKAKA
jgi:nucleolar protein 15